MTDELDSAVLEMVNQCTIKQLVFKKTKPLKFTKLITMGFHETSVALKSNSRDK